MGPVYLWPQYFGYELTLQEFLWVYRVFPLVGELRFFSLSNKQGKRIIDGCSSINKGWKKKFFCVSTAGLYESNLASSVIVPSV